MNLREGIVDAVTQGLCNTTSLSANLAKLGSRLWRSLGNDSLASGGQDLANAFGGTADIFCNRQPRDLSGEAAQPFTGGQCKDTPYRASLTYFNSNLGQNETLNSPIIFGPVSLGGTEQVGDNQFVVTVNGGTIPGGFPGAGSPSDWMPNLFTNDPTIISFSVQIHPAFTGQYTDDCGDPPPNPPDFSPTGFNPTVPISFDDNNGNPVSINVPVQFGPGDITEENDFNVPFTLEFSPSVMIDGSINLSTGDINIGTGGAGGGPQEIPENEPIPENSVLVGLRLVWDISSLNGTRATSRNDTPGGPVIYVPRLAAIRFEYRAPGGSGWGPSISAQSMESVIWAERPALDYDIELNGGSAPTVQKIVMTPSRFFTGATPA